MRLKSVDFPAPLGPIIACRSPFSMSKFTPRTILVSPKLLQTDFRDSTAIIRDCLFPGLYLLLPMCRLDGVVKGERHKMRNKL